jgi:pimeloyl-ACP methyl ester carboxylesterase
MNGRTSPIDGELVRIEADDGLELVGFYAAPPNGRARRAVLHTHGLAGNFYECRFVTSIARAVVDRGLAFLTYNNRGHDYRSDNLVGRGAGTESRLGGASFDLFEDCVLDMRGAAAFLARRGHDEIVFEGHSLGTNRVVYYLSEAGDDRSVATVLISPPDIFGLRELSAESTLADSVDQSRRLVASGESETLVDAGYVVQYSAATVVSFYGDPARTDIFPFRLGDSGDYRRLGSLNVPVLATFGTVDEAVTVPVVEAVSLFGRHAPSTQRVEVETIAGANHVYCGFEDVLASKVARFVAEEH